MPFNLPVELNKIENPYEITTEFGAGTCYQLDLITSFTELQILFGPPAEGDQCKVSTEWTFKSEGKFFSIYDWKSTDLYDDNLPSVEDLRSLPSHDWHIGAVDKESAQRFKNWVEKKLDSVVVFSCR